VDWNLEFDTPLENQELGIGKELKLTAFGIVAGITTTMATGLAAPDSDERTGVAIGTTPSENIAIGSLDDSKDVTGALVGHVEGFKVHWRCVSI
jgi:hypothetical protein